MSEPNDSLEQERKENIQFIRMLIKVMVYTTFGMILFLTISAIIRGFKEGFI